MRKLMFSPKSGKPKKLTRHDKETPSPPRTADSSISRLSIDEPFRSPRPSLSSASPGTANSRGAATDSLLTQELKPPHSSPSERRPSSALAPDVSNGTPRRMASIRPVTSFDDGPPPPADSSLEASPSLSNGRSNSVLSSSPNSNASAMSPTMERRQHDQNGTSDRIPAGRLRPKISAQYLANASHDGGRRAISPRPVEIPQRDSSIGGAERSAAKANADGQDEAGFDSAVGKAALGKTGRVMNKLISENEALKRDLRIEKLNSEESRREAKLLQDKMERMVADYESRLLEANVTKTLLARKERQVEGLQGAVELEKKRTTDAQSRERTWKEEMEKMRDETTRKVEDATSHAALMEGRYNAISSHWKDQGEEVKRATTKMGKEVASLVAERKKDDEKITTLRDLCDQQDGNIKDLLQQKDALARQFEAYKKEQEALLQNIKANASKTEEDQQRMLLEAKETLDKLKWALNIKENVKWAK
ncbi:hypothetical protein J7T55_008871 [Diaporthe amygdali]|uniref:uncharacterized protein n=1 Tax=Phomopsis amygdali TaxID=1214568 RepID=UPI0022FDF759|nr:uncharacterized protein J7T55_008871 [Diaporthe amygdali]KAJ0121704.1 hypothetical protein J7T55_008871 [Diaporthe amygdali]